MSNNQATLHASDDSMRVTIRWLAWIGIMACYVLLRYNAIDIPLDRDEGGYGYVGQLINSGDIPYRDVYNHKPPLVWYLYALGLHFVPPTAKGVHLFAHAYNFLTLLTLFFVAKIGSRSTTVGLWTAFIYALFSSSQVIQGFSASTELFMLLPIALSLLFAVSLADRPSLWRLALSGVFAAAACWVKPQAFTSVFLILLFSAYQYAQAARSQGSPLRAGLTAGSAWVLGSLAFSIPLVAYFFFQGVLPEFYYWIFEHNQLYSGQAVGTSGSLLHERWWERMGEVFVANPLVVVITVAAMVTAVARKSRYGILLLLFLLFSLVGTMPGYAYRHYFMQIAPALALAAGYGLSQVDIRLPNRFHKKLFAASAIIALLFTRLFLQWDYYAIASPLETARKYFGVNPFAEAQPLAEFIKEGSKPDDRIFIFGSEPEVFFLSERKSVTPHIFMYPLTRSFPRHGEFQVQAWEDINRHQPKFILTINISSSILWDEKVKLWLVPKLEKLILQQYELVGWMAAESPDPELHIASVFDKPSIRVLKAKNAAILVYRKKSETRQAD